MSCEAKPMFSYSGVKALVMGLGLHGGGLESARFLAAHGAEVTVTDLRDETILAPSIRLLEGLPIRFVLGRHDMDDFSKADMVIKNPAVKPDSPYLRAAKRIETDIGLFLRHCPARLWTVTGSKGKSSTSSALHFGLSASKKTYLGGNITVSPLTFLEQLGEQDDVVLELSSWQLGDLRGRTREDGSLDAFGRPMALLKPRFAVFTAILPDHLDRYGTMEAYVADKRVMYAGQDNNDCTVVADDAWGQSFGSETRARVFVYAASPLPPGRQGGWIVGADGEGGTAGSGVVRLPDGSIAEIVPPKLLVPGAHQKRNLLAAGLALLDSGLSPGSIRDALGAFPGIEHRLEFFHASGGISYYNDTAATIPEAAAAAIRSFDRPPVLVAGGTDKALDFSPLAQAAGQAKALVLLAGTGSAKLQGLLDSAGMAYHGPFDDLDAAVLRAAELAAPGDSVVLSPGCASFGMFQNEFDRGRKWKAAVLRLA